ncbi:MAG: hypothetical protein QM767_02180 [Anaeromyxobacter sp.]
MTIGAARAVARFELSDDSHMARLLLLVHGAGGRTARIEGLTKLVKLDFLLRYPPYFERALQRLGYTVDGARIEPFERQTIEATMIRFKYGPWDPRYRRWLALLKARQLITTDMKGRTLTIALTESGRAAIASLQQTDAFRTLALRATMLGKAAGHMSPSKIKDFIYEAFPEVTSLEWGEEIA